MAQGTADIPNSFGVNEWFQFFGQAVTHDVAEASTGAVDPSGQPTQVLFVDGLPFPIVRTPAEIDSAGVRQQINEETSFLDLSFVYGNNQTRLDLARATLPGGGESAKLLLGPDDLLPTIKEVGLDSGLTSLEVLAAMRPDGFGGLPDPNPDPAPPPPNAPPDPATFENLYYAGDNRVNQTPALVSQHLIWTREHNYQVDQLTPMAQKYGWTQDQLFEAARAITEAEWQHVVYDEYVPALLGQYALDAYHGYKKNVDPGILNEWTTVAFRFGHDQSSNNLVGLNEDGSNAFTTTLGQAFGLAAAAADVPGAGHSTADLDAWIRGLTSRFTQEIDGLVVDGNRNLLFGIGVPAGPTADLEAFDIQRGRDHGVGNYNELREGLGLCTYDSFEAFGAANNLDPARLAALKAVYTDAGGVAHIEWLDSIVGGLLEKKYYDSQLGETFTILNVMQFEALRDGDRFFYESRLKDFPDLLDQVEATTFADIIQRNSGIDHVYHDAFAAHNRVTDTDGTIDGSTAKDLAIGTDLSEVIKTLASDDDIYAGKGNDKVYAGAGNDLVSGDAGADWLWGDGGRDVFLFAWGSGKDKIQDFDVKQDKIDLSAYGFDSWKDVSKAIKSSSNGITIKLDGQNTVELVGVKAKNLSEKNFILDDHDAYAV